ncbi:MAG: hypothetical protein ABW072_17210 [Sedimenticola sp.]
MDKIRRHSAVAGGNFERIFEGAEIPPLPAAIAARHGERSDGA